MRANLGLLSDFSDHAIESMFNLRGVYFALLFRRSDKAISHALQRNWAEFDGQLGQHAHIFTFLEGEREAQSPNSVTVNHLRFPKYYETAIGWACGQLGFGTDLLPALVCLNGRDRAAIDGGGPPYWPLGVLPMQQADLELRRVVSQIAELTASVRTRRSSDWRDEVASHLAKRGAGADLVRTYRATPDEIKKFLRGLFNFMRLGVPDIRLPPG